MAWIELGTQNSPEIPDNLAEIVVRFQIPDNLAEIVVRFRLAQLIFLWKRRCIHYRCGTS
jgi:hypothetical protein